MSDYLRRLAMFVAAAVAVGAAAVPALALSVTVNGQTVSFSPPPISRAGRVFVPLRGVFERLGASVVYASGAINATGNSHTIALHIGSTQATIDGQPSSLDVAPFVVGASTYVPLRFVSQALGAGVNYDAANQVVALTAPGGAAPAATPAREVLVRIRPARASSVRSEKPTISADFVQPVDPNSVHLTLDGLDITNAATRSSSGFVYAPPSPLQSMRHVVQVNGTFASGGTFAGQWAFISGSAAPSNSITIDAPVDGSNVGSTFTVSGRTVPNARVHVVAGATASVGGVFSFGAGNFTADTTADANGRFSQSVTLQTVGGATVGLTVTSTDPDSQESAEKKLRLRAQ